MNARSMLVLAMSLLSFPAFGAVTTDTSTPSISVSGEAEVRLVPDEVFFDVAVRTVDKDVMTASRENDAKVKKLVQAARDFGIPAAMIQTSEITIHRKSNRDDVFTGFEITKKVSICLKELGSLVKAGANELPGIDFRSTKLEEAKSKARLQAVAAAREKASAMAGVLGEKIGRPLAVKEAPESFTRFAYVDPSSSSTHGGFAPGEIGVHVTVNVQFALAGS
jgi:uncharacterized protein